MIGMRSQWSWWDDAIRDFHKRWVEEVPTDGADCPKPSEQDLALTSNERQLSASLMRINHAGEVCAQALYLGHAEACYSPDVRQHMFEAAHEERAHLLWCQKRLHELSSHTSYLQPLWFSGAYAIGYVTARIGDDWGLGFVAETERQVEAHLSDHLLRLPIGDHTSRAILQQMRLDEIEHGDMAMAKGGRMLPEPVVCLMHWSSKVMTTLAYWL